VPRPRIARHWRPLAAGGAAAVLAVAGISLTLGTAEAGTLTGTFYRNPDTSVAAWVAANPNDSRAARIDAVINSQPTAKWLSNVNVSTVQSEVSTYVGAANARNQIPQLVIYGMPNRDCGGASAGGAANFTVWQQWISNIAAGLGNRPVLILMEPDAVALTTCLDQNGINDRNNNTKQAVQKIKAANPSAKVYLDAGHSAWHAPAEIARRLDAAGVRTTDGFYTNPSNYRPNANEISYGQSILNALGNPSNVHQVIDTSRNGNGPSPVNPQPNGWPDWCDYQNARVGTFPTTNTGIGSVDAFVWIKPPGEADGCAAAAGQFVPDLAFTMTQGVVVPTTAGPNPTTAGPNPTISDIITSPSSARPSSARPSSAAPSSAVPTGCTIQYDVASQWANGFVANVTIINNGDAQLNGWTLALTYSGNQQVSNAWNVTVSQSSNVMTFKNISWNGSLPPRGGSQTFGFQGSYSGTNADPTATLGGVPCTVL
jgi:endoglucanase